MSSTRSSSRAARYRQPRGPRHRQRRSLRVQARADSISPPASSSSKKRSACGEISAHRCAIRRQTLLARAAAGVQRRHWRRTKRRRSRQGRQDFAINTSGGGLVPECGYRPEPCHTEATRSLLGGAIAVHGIAIMSVREGLEFEASEIASQTAPAELASSAKPCSRRAEDIHVLRDPTRGVGVTSGTQYRNRPERQCRHTSTKRASQSARSAKGACEILGLDPLFVANEGKLLAVVPARAAARVLAAMRAHPLGADASMIGEVTADPPSVSC